MGAKIAITWKNRRTTFAAEAKREPVSLCGRADHDNSAYIARRRSALLEQAEEWPFSQSQGGQLPALDQ